MGLGVLMISSPNILRFKMVDKNPFKLSDGAVSNAKIISPHRVEFFNLDEDKKEKELNNYINKRIELILKVRKIKGILKGFYHGHYKEVILSQNKQQAYIKLYLIEDFKVLD